MTQPLAARPSLALPDGLPGRIRRMRLLGLLIALALLATAYFLVRGLGPKSYRLRMSAGDALGHRHQLAEILVREAAGRRLELQLHPNAGSEESLAEVARGRLDIALIQGGLETRPEIRQVAVLVTEPLHLLVRSELLQGGFEKLRGARLNLSTPGSGTRKLALQALEVLGLKPGDYVDQGLTYAELEKMPAAELPDGVFVVSALPSQFAEWIVSQRQYRLLSLPFGEAMSLRDRSLQDVVIPAYTYSAVPAVPSEPIHTIAPWMSIVAHESVPNEAIIRLLEAVYDGDFMLRAELPYLDFQQVLQKREFQLHPGTVRFLNRNQPLITGEFIEGIENLRSFLVSGLLAVFLAWRWYRRRAQVGFERFLDDVTRVELELIELSRGRQLDGTRALAVEQRLSQLKSDALEQFSAGRLRGDELLASFLTHVTDVRNCLHWLTAANNIRPNQPQAR
jgi:TRAP-type uncharacterized transport system substrate-binding protein